MKLIITPGSSLLGDVSANIPGDKSISHRAALFSSFAYGESRIENFQVSGVTRPMLQALTALKIRWELNGTHLVVYGNGLSGLKNSAFPIDCGNSATTMRLLAGIIAGAGISAVLEGTPGLRRRPMGRIVDPLKSMGVEIASSPAGTAPLQINKRPPSKKLIPLDYSLPVASAQVKSCLLLASLGSSGKNIIKEPGTSRDHTERMLSSMGVQISTYKEGSVNVVEITPSGSAKLTPLDLSIPGDPSAAAFLIVAALITKNSRLLLKNICLNPTRTGLLDALQAMGARIESSNLHHSAGEPVGDLEIESSSLRGTEISGELVVRMIDEFPIFAVAAAAAQGTTVVHDAAELRTKESDRISMLAQELRMLGVTIEEHPDGFTIEGGKLKGGIVQSHGDHRLAMALTVAGLIGDTPTTVQNAECMGESFPGFEKTLQSIGVKLAVEE